MNLRDTTLLPDGRLLVVGDFRNALFTGGAEVQPFQEDGSLDPSWYRARFDTGTTQTGALVEKDGRIILLGEHLTRVYPDGTPDPGFNVHLVGWKWNNAIDSEERLVAAGDFGVAIVELGTGAPAAPRLVQEAPVSISRIVYAPLSFAPSIVSTIDANFQWFHDGLPMEGETRRFLTIAASKYDDAGSYSIRVTDPNGVFEGEVLRLEVTAAAPDSPDYSWRPDEHFPWVTGGFPTPDGGILMWNEYQFTVVKLLENGRTDPSFKIVLNEQDASSVIPMAVNPVSGELLVRVGNHLLLLDSSGRQTGEFGRNGDEPLGSFLSWRPDRSVWMGRISGTEQIIFALRLGLGAPPERLPFTFQDGQRLLPLSDGRLLFVSTVASGEFMVRRLSERFEEDTSFHPAAIRARDISSFHAVLAADGGLVLYGNLTKVNQTRVGNLAKLLPDGTVDHSFFVSHFSSEIETLHLNSEDGSMLAVGWFQSVDGLPQQSLCRLHPDGTLDPSFGSGYPLESQRVPIVQRGRVYFLPDFAARHETIRGLATPYPFRTTGGVGAAVSPDLIIQPRGKTIMLGMAFELRAAVSGHPAATWQWQRNGVDIPGANAPSLRVKATSFGEMGWYRAIATNPLGVAVSNEVLIDVIDKPLAGMIDETFQPPPVLSPNWRNAIVAVQSDGKTVVGNLQWGHSQSSPVVRLHHDGRIDAGFTAKLPEPDPFSILHIAVQSDQRILVGSWPKSQDFSKSLWRMNTDGTRDPSFVPELPRKEGLFPVAAAPVPWGDRILAAIGFQHRDAFISTPFHAFSFGKDGRNPLTMDTRVGFDLNIPYATTTIPVVASNGTAFVPVVFSGPIYSSVKRFSTDKVADGVFNEKLSKLNVFSFDIDPAGRLVVGVGNNSIEPVRLVRLTETGEVDPTFRESQWNGLSSLTVDSDGGVYVMGEFTSVDGEARHHVARLLPNGNIDRRFDPGSGFDEPPRRATITLSGDVLFSGPFNDYDGHDVRAIVRVHGVRDLPLEPMDPRIRDTLAGLANVQPDDLTREGLSTIAWLDLSHLGLDSLGGLEQCRGLRGLVLDCNRLADLASVALMPPLAILSIRGNPVASLLPLLERPPRHLVVDRSQAERFKSEIEALGNSTTVHILSVESDPVGDGLEWVERTQVLPGTGDPYAPPSFVRRSELSWGRESAPPNAKIEFSEDLLSWSIVEALRTERDSRVSATLPKEGPLSGYYRLSWE